MPIPSEIQAIIDRLEGELEEIEREITEGLNILRGVMSRFPDNAILVQYFAYLSSLLFFVETSRRQIQETVERLSPANVPIALIQESGEDLSTLLGRVIEGKIRVEPIITFLRGLP